MNNNFSPELVNECSKDLCLYSDRCAGRCYERNCETSWHAYQLLRRGWIKPSLNELNTKGEAGKRGMVSICPTCGATSENLQWNTSTDECHCTKCGWSNGINYKYLYQTLLEVVRVALSQYSEEDKFNKHFFLELLEQAAMETH